MDERLQVLIEELRHMRAARKMTQEELAKAINYRDAGQRSVL